jgi:hypothetical protein
MEIQRVFQPDWFQVLSDGDTGKQSSKKRAKKAADNTLVFLDECLAKKGQLEVGVSLKRDQRQWYVICLHFQVR